MIKLFNVQSTLRVKRQLTDTIYELKYDIPTDFTYSPGQFAGARVEPLHTRAYSIVDVSEGLITFLIDVKPGGTASKYFINAKVGDITNVLGPYGRFGIQPTPSDKVFISTGTGIAPFVPMIKQARQLYPDINLYNYFGVRYLKDDIAFDYIKDLLCEKVIYTRCVTRPENQDVQFEMGRVTEVLPKKQLDWKNTEFYICGSHQMILDTQAVLKTMGAEKVYFEKF